MTTAGLRRYGDWQHVATGCTALVITDYWETEAEGKLTLATG